MKTETVYKNIFASLIDNDLGKALNAYGEHLHSLNRPLFAERFHDIENDYRLMLDFLYRGFKDKEREALYNKLIGRLDRLVADTMLSEQIEKHPLFKEKSVRLQSFNAQKDFVKQQMEAFVADLAILDFDDDSNRKNNGNFITIIMNSFANCSTIFGSRHNGTKTIYSSIRIYCCRQQLK